LLNPLRSSSNRVARDIYDYAHRPCSNRPVIPESGVPVLLK
jgi:hypothetical protein